MSLEIMKEPKITEQFEQLIDIATNFAMRRIFECATTLSRCSGIYS
jgi:hypothetical protein